MIEKKTLSRRAVLRTVTAAGGVLIALPVIGCGGGEPDCNDLSGVDPAARTMRDTLHYSGTATDQARRCEACALYQAQAAGQCGGCQLFAGPVAPGGTCDSFAPRA